MNEKLNGSNGGVNGADEVEKIDPYKGKIAGLEEVEGSGVKGKDLETNKDKRGDEEVREPYTDKDGNPRIAGLE